MRWDLFCRVIDNFGDIGVCWRLAADLVAHRDAVRLFVDDPRALTWMAPQGALGLTVHPWPADDDDQVAPADTVIEAFACKLPDGFVRSMVRMAPPPVWINLEYLSAESLVDRHHGLRSPQLTGPGQGLTKWFFYPGFTAQTGGLIREADLIVRQQAFDPIAWLRARRIEPAAGERCVSLFCYANAALPALLDVLAAEPTLLIVTPGLPALQVDAILGPQRRRGALRAMFIEPLAQIDYDHLLWSCDLNLVRGEDSFVRAQWAGRPFLWQIYPQHDGVHAKKLAAFYELMLAGAEPSLAAVIRTVAFAWNGLSEPSHGPLQLPPRQGWVALSERWRTHLLSLPDLTTALRAFALRAR